jgi:hypothetical protein
VCGYRTCVLRKLHPHGGSVPRKLAGESLCGSAETIPFRYRVTMMAGTSRILSDGGPVLGDETGSHCAVKGEIDASEPPSEARVPR